MARFNVLSKECPACHAEAVERASTGISFNRPTHRCGKCGAALKSVFTSSALWAIPVGAALLSVSVFAILWLQQSQVVAGTFRAAIIGGIAAVAPAITFNVMLRGIVFVRAEHDAQPALPRDAHATASRRRGRA